MDLTINLYKNPPYPEKTFSFTIGLYGSFIPSGQGHFSEQAILGPTVPFGIPPRDLVTLLRTDSQLDTYNPYGVSGVLIEGVQTRDSYLGNWAPLQPVKAYNDFGVETGSVNGTISFLRPAYNNVLKTSLFSKSSGITNAQAHPLALAAQSNGVTLPQGMNYLSNAYYYITTKSDFNFSRYLVADRAFVQNTSLVASGLANNIRSISMTSGVITDILTY